MKLLLISNSTNAGEEYLRLSAARRNAPAGRARNRLRALRRGHLLLRRIRTQGTGAFRRAGHPRPLGAPGRGSRSARPPGRSDLRGRRQHLRAGQKDAAAGADAGHPAPDQGRRALRRLVGRQQRLLPDDLDHERHADRPARIVPGHRSGEVPDQPPLPRRQPRRTCRGDARAAHPRIHRGQPAPLGGRAARRVHAALRRRTAGTDRRTADADVPQGRRTVRSGTGRRPFVVDYK